MPEAVTSEAKSLGPQVYKDLMDRAIRPERSEELYFNNFAWVMAQIPVEMIAGHLNHQKAVEVLREVSNTASHINSSPHNPAIRELGREARAHAFQLAATQVPKP